MNVFTFIVIIVALGCITSIIQSRHKAKHGIVEDWMGNESVAGPPPDDAEKRALQREVEELRERVKVLERIAYDDRKRLGLADEIESLRDK
jgi:hypothetical protein